MVEFNGDVAYGVMMAVAALKMLVSWASLTVRFCEVRSDSVCAMIVTLRSTATAVENSTTPKNSTSISGRIMANSTAAMPRQSSDRWRAERRKRSHILVIGFIALI